MAPDASPLEKLPTSCKHIGALNVVAPSRLFASDGPAEPQYCLKTAHDSPERATKGPPISSIAPKRAPPERAKRVPGWRF
eukprot:9031341-Pyramimonas_sp.AAC.1